LLLWTRERRHSGSELGKVRKDEIKKAGGGGPFEIRDEKVLLIAAEVEGRREM